MKHILDIIERIIDGAQITIERARERAARRAHRRAVLDTKRAIDGLGYSLQRRIEAQPMVSAGRVISLPRHNSKRVH